MATKPTIEQLQAAVDTLASCSGVAQRAADKLGLPASTFKEHILRAKKQGVKPNVDILDNSAKALAYEVSRLQAELLDLQKEAISHAAIRRSILGLKEEIDETPPPTWLATESPKASSPGVPTLFLSDMHWGEIVHPSQINNVNKYNVKIAHARIDALIESTVHLLKIISPKMDYPGITLMLGGDGVSGSIHEELAQSNEMHIMPTVLDLFGKLASAIEYLADTFGRVFVSCVSGNHGRDTHKIYKKDRNNTSFDWLIYQFLARHFADDDRITFQIPDGPNAYFKIYSHRYLLTHGDEFRGGDGMIGCLGPIIRGDHKKRSRNGQIDMGYDTMLLGHFHQYLHHGRVIVNGSLKGYDEYAYTEAFGFEQPQQALWITHPRHGITFRMPVYVDRARPQPKTSWVSLAA